MFFCSWVPCLSWTVQLSAILQKKILQVPQIIWFSSIFVYLYPFKQWLWFWDPSFHTEDNWGTTITEGSKAHWCSRRKTHALRAGACILSIKSMHFVWSLLLGKIIKILQILQGVCKLLTTTVYIQTKSKIYIDRCSSEWIPKCNKRCYDSRFNTALNSNQIKNIHMHFS